MQGIVHRDLKPGNIMLTKTGARLLDFGLARLTAHGEQPAVESLTSAPTKQAPLTGQGTILGTLPYMAPEQVEGKPADARTDLWALGTILYEMVTGGRAFEASTPVSLVGAILEREPAPLAERQPLTPPSAERLVRRCLAKDPDERWDTAHDVAVRQREIAGTDPDAEARLRARSIPHWVIPALVAVAVTALLVGAIAEWWWLGPRAGAGKAPVVRSEIDLTADRPLRSPFLQNRYSLRRELDLSPDGTLLLLREDPDRGRYARQRGAQGWPRPSISSGWSWRPRRSLSSRVSLRQCRRSRRPACSPCRIQGFSSTRWGASTKSPRSSWFSSTKPAAPSRSRDSTSRS